MPRQPLKLTGHRAVNSIVTTRVMEVIMLKLIGTLVVIAPCVYLVLVAVSKLNDLGTYLGTIGH